MYNTITIHDNTVEYIRLDNDINGNPRYYIGLTSIMQFMPDLPTVNDYIRTIQKKKRYCSVYRGKRYGHGYVFQSYNLQHDLTKEIENINS